MVCPAVFRQIDRLGSGVGSVVAGEWTVTTGIATKAGSVLSDFLLAATTTGVVAYFDIAGGNTYIVVSDGLASGAFDTVVELVGITTATATIHIV